MLFINSHGFRESVTGEIAINSIEKLKHSNESSKNSLDSVIRCKLEDEGDAPLHCQYIYRQPSEYRILIVSFHNVCDSLPRD